LYEIYEDETFFYMVLEHMTGGEVPLNSLIIQLFDRITDRDNFSEREAVTVLRPIIDALVYCHSMGVVHRDLKVNIEVDIYILA
jgi:calcium/calmodulin-dependent protein kinase I